MLRGNFWICTVGSSLSVRCIALSVYSALSMVQQCLEFFSWRFIWKSNVFVTTLTVENKAADTPCLLGCHNLWHSLSYGLSWLALLTWHMRIQWFFSWLTTIGILYTVDRRLGMHWNFICQTNKALWWLIDALLLYASYHCWVCSWPKLTGRNCFLMTFDTPLGIR